MRHEHDQSRAAVKQPEHERTPSERAADVTSRCRESLAALRDEVGRHASDVIDDLAEASQPVLAAAARCRDETQEAISRALHAAERTMCPIVEQALASTRDGGLSKEKQDGVADAVHEFTSGLVSESARLVTEIGARLDAGATADMADLFERTGAKATALAAELETAIAQFDALDSAGRFLDGAVLGDFSDDPSTSATIGRIVGGLNPAADVRDVAAGIAHVVQGKEGAWMDLVMAGVGAVPVAGDAVKILGRAGGDVIEEAVEKAAKDVAHNASELRPDRSTRLGADQASDPSRALEETSARAELASEDASRRFEATDQWRSVTDEAIESWATDIPRVASPDATKLSRAQRLPQDRADIANKMLTPEERAVVDRNIAKAKAEGRLSQDYEYAPPHIPGAVIPSELAHKAGRVLGTTISANKAVKACWDDAVRAVLEHEVLSAGNYKELYKSASRRFWDRVAKNPAAKSYFVEHGFTVDVDGKSAAYLNVPGVSRQEVSLGIDHMLPKATGDNWRHSLDGEQLQFLMQADNTKLSHLEKKHRSLRR